MPVAPDLLEVPDEPGMLLDHLLDEQCGDGLPVVPATPERVQQMLDACPELYPDAVLGTVEPRQGVATVRNVAVNAVLAGCRPEYLEAVVTAVKCVLAPAFNHSVVQTTTHPGGPVVVLHGPLRAAVGANTGAGCFGPGTRANATIGRAVRFVLVNVGGAWPGVTDFATQGHPGKYSMCFAENEEASPWEAYHGWLGLDPDRSAVSVFPAIGPENVNDHVSTTPTGLLATVADTIAVIGANNVYFNMAEVVCVLCPEHAALVAHAGWSRDDVAYHLYEHARVPFATVRQGGMWGMQAWPRWMDPQGPDDQLVPVVRDPSDIRVLVAGGSGRHSAVFRGIGPTRSVSLQVGA